ncbi:MAG: nitroreductase family protein, partial [Proteobacteria bacterium]|nr:nitroreductase family protein [Pseudomonadota bacterium]
MNSRLFQSICLAITVFLICPVFASGQDPKPIQLLSPQKDTGRPLMQVLNDRKSSREFSDEKLPDQVLSNLLWAAAGVNRADSGKRTAPSAVNWQEIDIYVATSDGLFLYDSGMHALNPILPEDIRALTGRQPFVKNVPVNLVYVADFSKMG